MASTKPGIPAPAQVNARPSGKYAVQAPDAPVGSILRVTTRAGDIRFVELVCVEGKRMFVDILSEPIDFCDWDYATRVEADLFRRGLRAAAYADAVELHGAATFAASIHFELSSVERDSILRVTAAELTSRGKRGKADQVLALLSTHLTSKT